MAKSYENAKKILPPKLLAEVQEHFAGLLYVPKVDLDRQERNRLIRKCLELGVASADLACLTGLTIRRIQQICAAMVTD